MSGGFYGNVSQFVTEYLGESYRRQVDDLDTFWCPEWWRHAEAVVRLHSLWQSWEHARLNSEIGIGAWYLQHADPHMAHLLNRRGPFRYCGTEAGHRDIPGSLPLTPAPGGMFTDPGPVTGDRAFDDLAAFVERYFACLYRARVTDLDDTAWCSQWWRHADVVVRLDGLWRTWEHLRRGPADGLSVWFLDFADPQMRQLSDRHGPFRHCCTGAGHREVVGPLPVDPEPKGLRFSQDSELDEQFRSEFAPE